MIPNVESMAPIVTFVRHAQSLHNIGKQFHHLHDTNLTEFGENQCEELANAFPDPDSVELVVCSPLRRAIDTAMLGFKNAIDRCGKVVALAELQEISDAAFNIGTNIDVLRLEMEGDPIDFNFVTDDWNSKKGKFSSNTRAVEARAARMRDWLRDQPQKHIVVVTHGGFVHYLTQDWSDFKPRLGSGWANAEFRSYQFVEASDGMFLEETAKSKTRRQGNDEKAATELEPLISEKTT